MKNVTSASKLSYLILVLLAVAALYACGSSSSGPALPYTGQIAITCAEATANGDGICDPGSAGKPEREGMALLNSAVVNGVLTNTFESGFLNTDDAVMTDLTSSNGTLKNARVYLYILYGTICGDAPTASTGQTYPFDVPALSEASYGESGSKPNCATAGDKVYYTIGLYNAAHLDTETLGDASVDELIASSVIWFTYR